MTVTVDGRTFHFPRASFGFVTNDGVIEGWLTAKEMTDAQD